MQCIKYLTNTSMWELIRYSKINLIKYYRNFIATKVTTKLYIIFCSKNMSNEYNLESYIGIASFLFFDKNLVLDKQIYTHIGIQVIT